MKNEIILFENQEVKLGVSMKDYTGLNRNQIAELFDRDIKIQVDNIERDRYIDTWIIVKLMKLLMIYMYVLDPHSLSLLPVLVSQYD